MEIQFASSKLRRAFESQREAVRVFGEQIGKKYVMAVKVLQQTRSLDDIYKVPQFRFHALHGDRTGEFGMTLTGNWRLVVTNPNDQDIRIERVEDYHGR